MTSDLDQLPVDTGTGQALERDDDQRADQHSEDDDPDESSHDVKMIGLTAFRSSPRPA
jgi:hypothetical protein